MQTELLNEAKTAAARSGQSLTAFVEEAIRRQLLTRDKIREFDQVKDAVGAEI